MVLPHVPYLHEAILADESVVSWGNLLDGGDSSAVQHKLWLGCPSSGRV